MARQTARRRSAPQRSPRAAPPRSPWTPTETWLRGLLGRMDEVVNGRPDAAVAEATGFNPETVRRYLRNGPPGAEFIMAFCGAFGVSADWLLTGRAGKARGAAARQPR